MRTSLVKDQAVGIISIVSASSRTLKCLLFSLGSKLKEGFPYYSSQLWYHAICCCNNYKVSSRESLNTWHKAHLHPYPYLPTTCRSCSRGQCTQRTLPVHGRNCTSFLILTPFTMRTTSTAARSSSFQGPLPGYQPHGSSCESLNLTAPWSCPQLPIFLPP